ncbi:MAG: C25 family cysteine peptidase [Thermoplasmatota archaeon]
MNNSCLNKYLKASILIGSLIILIFMLNSAQATEIEMDFSFEEPDITELTISDETYHDVKIDGLKTTGDTGLPLLPVKTVKILLPQRGVLESIDVVLDGNTSMGQNYNVTLGKESVNLSGGQNGSNESYFNESIPYPTTSYDKIGVFHFRGHSFLIINLHPCYYIGETGEIYYYENISLTVTTNEVGNVSKFFRNTTTDEELIKEKVDNYDCISSYDTKVGFSKNSDLVDPQDSYDYVIITKKKFKNAICPQGFRFWYTFQDLADYKNSTGTQTIVVALEDILNEPEYHWDGEFGDGLNESIFNDTQCHIRNFIKDAFQNWGIEYVLIGGDHNNTLTDCDIVPARFFKYTEIHISKPSDIYYSCLDGNYNMDSDGDFGEKGDGGFGNGDNWEPKLGSGYCYAEADSSQYGGGFDVGLFSKELDMSNFSNVYLNFTWSFRSNYNAHIEVNVYSGGNDSENKEVTLWEKSTGSEIPDPMVLNFNPSIYTDPSEVYIEFNYTDSGSSSSDSMNIDDIKITGFDGTNWTVILNESFEGDPFPPDGWDQKKYSGEKEWAIEYYQIYPDLFAEVYIGRASVGNRFEVNNFVTKTLSYQKADAHDPYINKTLLLGARLNKKTWGGDYKDEIVDKCDNVFNSTGIPSENYTIDKLYDRDLSPDYWPKKELRRRLNNGVNIINYMGHGDWDGIGTKDYDGDFSWIDKFNIADVCLLHNNKYFFMYSMGCLNGKFHCWSSLPIFNITQCDSFAEFLTVRTKHGAYATIMNTGSGTFIPSSTNSSSQYFDRFFFNATFGGAEIKELGRANQESKENTLPLIYDLNVFYGLTLFGDPQISLKIPVENNPPNKPDTPTGYEDPDHKLFWTYYTSTTDPEGDQLYYKWEWDDVEGLVWWIPFLPYDSGDTASMIRPWLIPGTHKVRVKAMDIYGAESNWSDPYYMSVSFDLNMQINPNPAVVGETIDFNAESEYGETYTWDFGGSKGIKYGAQVTEDYDSVGEYEVILNVTGSENITSNATESVEIVLLRSEIGCSSNHAAPDETIYFTNLSKGYYEIKEWEWEFGDGNGSTDENPNHSFTSSGVYNVTLNVTDDEYNTDEFTVVIYVDTVPPEISNVSHSSEIIGYGTNITISAHVTDDISGIQLVCVNITCPDDNSENYTMNLTNDDNYECTFTNTWDLGIYNYTIWAMDNANNTNSSSGHSFSVSRSFGYTEIGASNQTIWDTITGSTFMVNEKCVADNLTVYINPGDATYDSHYQCMIYDYDDSELVGISDELNVTSGEDWVVFPFSEPKPVMILGVNYTLQCWSDNETLAMYYVNGTGYGQGQYFEGIYGYVPEDILFEYEDRRYSIYCSYSNDTIPPTISDVTDDPNTCGFGQTVNITAEINGTISGVDNATVNITYPDETLHVFTMDNTENDIYQCSFTATWLVDQYNYSIWAIDAYGNQNTSTGYSFTVSSNATIGVCTIKNIYGANESINITDPPVGSPFIGYELLDNDSVLHIWNKYDSYYFNTSSGLQLTNNYDEYWSHNVLMLGYYNNDQWNLMYRTDELSGFTKSIDSDNDTFVNATLWKDLTYGGYAFRLAIRYHLGVDDNELTIIPYIKNIDDEDIPYVLGFGWELQDIQIDMTETGDYIQLGNENYYLNQSLDNSYTNLSDPIYCFNEVTNETEICGYSDPAFYLMENITETTTESLYLRWDKDLTYKLEVKSRAGQYNAPVTLFVRIGTLNNGQEKSTDMFWYDADQYTYYFDSYDTKLDAWETNPSNMVDGSTSTFASTDIRDDSEYCDSTSFGYGGAPSGTVSKVEIRAYGKYEEIGGSINIKPTFNGGNGDNHYFSLPGSAGWSSWFDITDDTNAPEPWTWSDVESLDCSIIVCDIRQGDTFYCHKVEIRVTNNEAPVDNNPAPADDSINVSISPTLSINVSDAEGDSMNITWYSNSSGSWTSFGTNNSVGNGTYYQSFSNASVNGQWWYWKVNVSDGSNTLESSVYKFYTGVQSKIFNTGSTNISGYLLIQVEFFSGTQLIWVLDNDTINETTPRTINVGEQLALDLIFNGEISTDDLTHGDGTYRVYAAFRDPDGDVLICDDETLLAAWYEFEVDTS